MSDNEFSELNNHEITIQFQNKIISDLKKDVESQSKLIQIQEEKIKALQDVKRNIEEAKKKTQIEQIQGKYFASQPRKLTWDLIVELSSHILEGFNIQEACDNLGISDRILQQWLKKGKEAKKDNDIHYQLFIAIKRVKNFEEKRYKTKVDKAIFNDLFEKEILKNDKFKDLDLETKAKIISEYSKIQVVQGKFALNILQLKSKKYNPVTNPSFQSTDDEYNITRTFEETITSSKTESVEQHETVTKIQEIIKKKSASVSIFESGEDEIDLNEI